MDVVALTFGMENSEGSAAPAPDAHPSAGSSQGDRSAPKNVVVLKDLKALRERKEELERESPKDKRSLGQWLAEYLLIDLSTSPTDDIWMPIHFTHPDCFIQTW